MKVELNISDDRELRGVIRDMIKGEVTAIMRGEIRGIITDLVKEGAWPKEAKDLQRLVELEVASYIRELLRATYQSDPVKVIAREEVSKYIRELFEKPGRDAV